MAMAGCSFKVSTEKVYGTYVAKYSFGTDTLKLDRNGSFIQTVAIENEPTQTVSGHWSFDSKISYAKFYGLMIVDDGNGRLNRTWRTPISTLVEMDIERHGFKIVMESAGAAPYVKER